MQTERFPYRALSIFGWIGYAVAVDLHKRPEIRAECKSGPRPCGWVFCPHHLISNVSDAGTLKMIQAARKKVPRLPSTVIPLNPEIPVEHFLDTDGMLDHLDKHGSCALDKADDDSYTLLEIGRMMQLTRERVRQHEVDAVRKLQRDPDARRIFKLWTEGEASEPPPPAKERVQEPRFRKSARAQGAQNKRLKEHTKMLMHLAMNQGHSVTSIARECGVPHHVARAWAVGSLAADVDYTARLEKLL